MAMCSSMVEHYQHPVSVSQQDSVCRSEQNVTMPLKDRLKSARERRGFTSQETLAAAVGCGQSVIGNLESGENGTSKWLPRIAWKLRVPAAWLTEEDYDGLDPFADAEGGGNVVSLNASRDPVVAAAIEVMERVDARGKLECFAAVRGAADRYQSTRTPKASGE